MEEAIARAGVSPTEVDYLEAHAVGSQLGDPIELNAVASVYAVERDQESPLLMGSVKSNIGHAEWAAGISAFIKAVLSISKGVIPGIPKLQTLNPNVDWDQITVRVTSKNTPWPAVVGRQLLAGVSAFGPSGSNAHVLIEGYGPPVVDSAPGREAASPSDIPWPIPAILPGPVKELTVSSEDLERRATRLLPLSGKSPSALRELAARYLAWLDEGRGDGDNEKLSDLDWTASVGRTHFQHRAGLVFGNATQLRQALQRLVGSEIGSEGTMSREANRVAFAYTGMPGGWVGLGEALYRSEPTVRAVLNLCDQLVQKELGVSLLDVIFRRPGSEGGLAKPDRERLANYALEAALTALWRSVGVQPTALLGQGIGELTAAQAAGVLSLEDGLRLACALTSPEASLPRIAATSLALTLISGATGRKVGPSDQLHNSHWRQMVKESAPSQTYMDALAETGVDTIVEMAPKNEKGSVLESHMGTGWQAGPPPILITAWLAPAGVSKAVPRVS